MPRFWGVSKPSVLYTPASRGSFALYADTFIIFSVTLRCPRGSTGSTIPLVSYDSIVLLSDEGTFGFASSRPHLDPRDAGGSARETSPPDSTGRSWGPGSIWRVSVALSPGDRVKTFDRIIRIRELPSLELVPPDHRFDVERFLEVRASKECSEFRTWLRTVGRATDGEIHEKVGTVRTRLGPYVHGTSGKAARIAISVITGFIPLFGAALGAGWSVVDSYLLERVFPVSGPTVFLNRDYNSLFKPSRPNLS